MSILDNLYIRGFTSAMSDLGICKFANIEHVANLVESKMEKFAQEGMPAQGNEPSPQELQQMSQSGISDGDIQAAAKVVQVLAEMKQQADMLTNAQQAPAAMGGQQAQPPMPPQPQAPAAPGTGDATLSQQ